MNGQAREGFWRESLALHGSVTPRVMPHVLLFGFFACAICAAAWAIDRHFKMQLGIEVTPYEFVGVGLSVLLVLRTSAGYERWWEARKLWGGIVNQTRNLAISALSYGPQSAAWRESIVRWTAAFPHAARHSLRGEKPGPEVTNLLGEEAAARLAAADHMPGFVTMRIAELLREGCEQQQLDRFFFLQIDRERATLIDHIGACERILKTPLPRVYSIKIRRFILLFLMTLPLALLHRLNSDWLVPGLTVLVAYPLLALDQMGIELENPFSKRNLSHLPLDNISETIERNLFGFLKGVQAKGADGSPPSPDPTQAS